MILQFPYFILFIISYFNGLSAAKVHHDLLVDLFQNYDKRIRPFERIGNGSSRHPVKVQMSIVLGILIQMRENEQVAAYVISHIQRWRDPRLRWNPKSYEGITEVIVPTSLLWQPKMFVYNSMDTKEMLNVDKFDVRLKHDGQIKINIPQYVTCTCRLDIEQFPFDTQFCVIALASPLLTVDEMAVQTNQPPKESSFSGNAEWDLINVSVRDMNYLEEGEFRAEVHYIFHLRRRPMFYITVIVVPIFLISVLSILGIFTPGSNEGPRSEKVSLGLGSLLAMTVLLGIVAGAMPKSNSIPLLGYYILSVILICAIAVALSMAFMTISKRFVDNARIPSKFIYQISFVTPKIYSDLRTRMSQEWPRNSPSYVFPVKRRLSHKRSINELLSGLKFSDEYQPEKDRVGTTTVTDAYPPETPTKQNTIWRRRSDYGIDCRSINSLNNGQMNGGICGEQKLIDVIEMSPKNYGTMNHHANVKRTQKVNGYLRNSSLKSNGQTKALHGELFTLKEEQEVDEGFKSRESIEELTEELSEIRSMLSYVAQSQRIFRQKIEREVTREKIEKEWFRVFIRIDYVCLILFQSMNFLCLAMFLRNAWTETPQSPTKPLI